MADELDREYLPHDKDYYKHKTNLFFVSLFKYLFIFLLIIMVFRFFLNLDTYSTIDIFTFLENCPDTLGSLTAELKTYFNYTPDPDGFVSMLGFAELFTFFHTLFGILGYVFGAFFHIINIIIYFITFIFV